MSTLAVVSSLAFTATPFAGAGGAEQAWARKITGPGADVDDARFSAVSPDGARVFVVGTTSPGGTGADDYATYAFDAATGMGLWRQTYNGPGNAIDIPEAIGTSPDGASVFVTGYSLGNDGAPDYDFATIAYDAVSGAVRWIARFNSPRSRSDVAHALAVSPDGATVFVAGYGDQHRGRTKYVVVAYDAASGTQRWAAVYAGPQDVRDEIREMTISPDGARLFVTGLSDDDFLTLAYDAMTGHMEWSARYDGPAHRLDVPNAIGVSPDGASIFVTGESDDEGLNDASYATVAYEAAAGTQQWEVRHTGAALAGGAQAVVVAPNGELVFVTGSTKAPNGFLVYDTLAYGAATGGTVWEARYHSALPGDNSAAAATLAADGSRLYVTGTGADSHLEPTAQFATVAYDTDTGQPVWTQVFDSPGQHEDEAMDVEVGPDGNRAYVTGFTSAFGSALYGWLVAYDA